MRVTSWRRLFDRGFAEHFVEEGATNSILPMHKGNGGGSYSPLAQPF
jgi:hypothetical protein